MPTVAYTSPFVPPEWIAACGCEPRRVVPRADAAERSGVPIAGVCPFARAFVGEVRSGDGVDAVVVTSTCDQMRRAAEHFGGKPTFLMNVPATWRTPGAFRLYLEELRRLARFLEGVSGSVLSEAELAKIMEASTARSAPLPVADAASARGAAPVAVIGGPLLGGAAWLHDAVARAGGRVVLDGTEGGERTLPGPLDRRRLSDEAPMVLAEAYFGRIPDAFRRPDSMLYEWAAREVPASGARGVLVVRYTWCDMWAVARERLAEATARPVVEIDLAGDPDDGTSIAGRIAAFVEALS
ncbi:MAG: 2-hydroxyacyl-CoA dehydratase [Planctomycetota bacterium]